MTFFRNKIFCGFGIDRPFAFLLGDCGRSGSRKGGKPQRHSVWSFLFASLRLCVTLSLNLFTASQRLCKKSGQSPRKARKNTERMPLLPCSSVFSADYSSFRSVRRTFYTASQSMSRKSLFNAEAQRRSKRHAEEQWKSLCETLPPPLRLCVKTWPFRTETDFRYILSDLPTRVAKMRKTREGTADARRITQMHLQNLRTSAFICGSTPLLTGFSCQISKGTEKLCLPHFTNNSSRIWESDMHVISHINSNA